MSKHGSIGHQVNNRLKEMARFGESKHEAKRQEKERCAKEGVKWNPSKTPGIYSFKTYEDYLRNATNFANWCKSEFGIKDISRIQQTHVDRYFQQQISEGRSAWTVQSYSAAISKVWDIRPSIALPERKVAKVERSRGERFRDTKYNPKNYEKQITIARATGCRRQSLMLNNRYCINDKSFWRDCDGNLRCHVVEKGGRHRDINVVKSVEQEVIRIIGYNPPVEDKRVLSKTEFIERHTNGCKLFDRNYTTKIDNHAFRGEYAQERYREVLQEYQSMGIEVESDYKGFDSRILERVTSDLGHNRIDVIVGHYMRL